MDHCCPLLATSSPCPERTWCKLLIPETGRGRVVGTTALALNPSLGAISTVKQRSDRMPWLEKLKRVCNSDRAARRNPPPPKKRAKYLDLLTLPGTHSPLWGSAHGSKPGCFKPGCLQFLHGSALLHSFAPFCALLRTCVCALWRSFTRFCVQPRLERPRLGTAEPRALGDSPEHSFFAFRLFELGQVSASPLVAFQTPTQNRSVLATQCPKSIALVSFDPLVPLNRSIFNTQRQLTRKRQRWINGNFLMPLRPLPGHRCCNSLVSFQGVWGGGGSSALRCCFGEVEGTQGGRLWGSACFEFGLLWAYCLEGA